MHRRREEVQGRACDGGDWQKRMQVYRIIFNFPPPRYAHHPSPLLPGIGTKANILIQWFMTSDNGKGDKSCTSQPAEHSTPISSSFYRTLSLARRAAASLESSPSSPGSVSFHRPSDTKLSSTSIRGGGGGTVRPQHIIFRTQQAKPPLLLLLLLANGKLLPLPPLLCTFPIFLPNPFSCADTPSDQWHGMIAILIGSPSVLRISISLACAYKVAEIVTVVALSSSSGGASLYV